MMRMVDIAYLDLCKPFDIANNNICADNTWNKDQRKGQREGLEMSCEQWHKVHLELATGGAGMAEGRAGAHTAQHLHKSLSWDTGQLLQCADAAQLRGLTFVLPVIFT